MRVLSTCVQTESREHSRTVHCGELHTLVRATCVDVSGHDASLEALRSYWCDTGTSTRARDAPTACTLCG